jgi:hypothetical protein
MESVYDYYNNTIGVEARAIFTGPHARPDSIGVISERGLQLKIKKGHIRKLRKSAPNQPVSLDYSTLPPSWQKFLMESNGKPEKVISFTNFEKNYAYDSKALAFFTTYTLADGKYLPEEVVNEYTINASVLNCVGTVYSLHYKSHKNMKQKVTDVWAITSAERVR